LEPNDGEMLATQYHPASRLGYNVIAMIHMCVR